MLFSVAALSQSHAPAECLPQEHFASCAQTQVEPERPQQAGGEAMVAEAILFLGWLFVGFVELDGGSWSVVGEVSCEVGRVDES